MSPSCKAMSLLRLRPRGLSTVVGRLSRGGIILQPAAGSCIFATANPQPPIPGLGGGPGAALRDNALPTSMVYHMDRLANPDINPKPGTIDAIRRTDEIHVYVARYFDHNTGSLCLGGVGKQLATSLKSLNERLWPVYYASRLPICFSNRVCIGDPCLTWGRGEG